MLDKKPTSDNIFIVAVERFPSAGFKPLNGRVSPESTFLSPLEMAQLDFNNLISNLRDKENKLFENETFQNNLTIIFGIEGEVTPATSYQENLKNKIISDWATDEKKARMKLMKIIQNQLEASNSFLSEDIMAYIAYGPEDSPLPTATELFIH